MHQAKPTPSTGRMSKSEPPVAPMPCFYHWLGAEAEAAAAEARDCLDPASLYHWLGAEAEAAATAH